MTDHTDLLERWVERLRQEEPRAVAILCHGSYARGEAEAHSDLDLDVLIEGEPDVGYRSAFDELADGHLLHLTIATMTLDEWLEQFTPDAESEEWALFLPARQVATLLWVTPEAQTRLAGHITLELKASPQLQDLLECAAKIRNASARGDELGVRLAAQDLAMRAPALLVSLNPPLRVDTRRAALAAALDLAVTPANYRDDMLVCLGMSGRATRSSDVQSAALRLTTGILTMLQAHYETIAEYIGEPGLPEALADGRLLRLLTQDD